MAILTEESTRSGSSNSRMSDRQSSSKSASTTSASTTSTTTTTTNTRRSASGSLKKSLHHAMLPADCLSAMTGPTFSRWGSHKRRPATAVGCLHARAPRRTRSMGQRGRRDSERLMQRSGVDEMFASLPMAVQRKQFSTLERLRLANRSTSTNARSHHAGSRSAGSDSVSSRPCSSSIAKQRGPRRLQKPALARPRPSEAEIRWFLSLPEKIRRQQLSPEEQARWGGVCNEVILDAADETLYKLRQHALQHAVTFANARSTTLSLDSLGDDADSCYPRSMADSVLDSFRWMDSDQDLDLTLPFDEYHSHLADDNAAAAPSHARKRSSSQIQQSALRAVNRFSASAVSRLSSPLDGTPKPLARHTSRRTTSFPVQHGAKASVNTIDSEAAHYQDPEARLKLRVYLASPQKFDEAIEFGFPSTDRSSLDQAAISAAAQKPRLSASTRSTQHTSNASAFLRGDTFSLFEDPADPADDISSMAETADMPLTPSNKDVINLRQPRRPLPITGLDPLSTSKPTLRTVPDISYAQASAGSREMTLRMTLTRPDLRAGDDVLYGWQEKTPSSSSSPQAKEDPLALADLPSLADTPDGTMGPFGGPDGWGPPPLSSRDGGLVRKFWKRVVHSRPSGAQRRAITT